MAYDIMFAPVGVNSSKPGDAILIRYGTQDSYELMVVDGGTEESGEYLVNDILTHCPKDAVIKHMILTHSDQDHASGLRVVLKKLKVENLWVNPPWHFAAQARPYFKNKNWTDEGLSDFLYKKYDIVAEVVDLAFKQDTKVKVATQSVQIGPFTVLSPTAQALACLIPQFNHEKDPDVDAIKDAGYWIGTQSVVEDVAQALGELLEKAAEKVSEWTDEQWDIELLKDGGITNASNESSVVLYGNMGDGNYVLLTGDAGVKALTWAADYADGLQLPLQKFSFVQIPHHGSRRNVGPTILNRMLGPAVAIDAEKTATAIVSAPKDDATHPRKMVLNAFMRRGAKVLATQGQAKSYRSGLALRDGWVVAEAFEFFSKVEAYES